MEDGFRVGEDRRVGLELPDILPVAGEIGISLEMIEIAAMTADQIIDDADRKARADQCIDQWLPMKPAPPVTTATGLPLLMPP